MTSPLSWLLARPLVTHTLLAAAYTLALGSAATALGLPYPWIVAALVVSTFFFGREAGQREHDLKHMTPPVGAIQAWLGAEFAYRWDASNFAQWLVAAGSSAAVAAVLTIAGR